EKRTERSIDDAGRQNLVFTKTSFTLEEAAGDLARGIGLLLVFAGQRKKIEPGSLFGGNGRDEHDAAFAGDDHRAVRLLGKAASLEGQRLAADHDGFTNK